MTISFDLDDTLIPTSKNVELEPRSLLLRLLGVEVLRLGTRDLIRSLKASGHRVVIYTTSFRSSSRIKFMFLLYGIPVAEATDQSAHNARLGSRASSHSKLPSAFGIDLHIDDLPGLALEAKRHGFRALIVDRENPEWAKEVLDEVERLNAARSA
jgi:hypothetical protein